MEEIFFIVKEDENSGHIARAIGHSIFTEGESIAELKSNIKDVLECHFDDLKEKPKLAHLHYVRDETLALV